MTMPRDLNFQRPPERRPARTTGWLFAVCLLGALTLTGRGSAAAQGTGLDDAMDGMAGDLCRYLTNEGTNALSVGRFSAPPAQPASSGAAIKKLLVECLTQQEIDCEPAVFLLSCQGHYTFQPDEPSLVVVATVLQGTMRCKIFEAKVYDVEDIATLLGLTGSLPVAQPARGDALVALVEDTPTVHVDETARVLATPDRPFALQIQVQGLGGEYALVPVEKNDVGFAEVRLSAGQVYAVKVFNNADFDAAVSLNIDGLNLFAFAEKDNDQDLKQLGKFLVPAQSSRLLRGWYLNDRTSAEFLVVKADAGVVARVNGAQRLLLANDDRIGTITVTFAAAVPLGAEFPPDEPLSQALEPVRTVPGELIEQAYRRERRKIGLVREVITVRYCKP